MLEAHIASPRGSLYYAGSAQPYDLEILREHVRDAVGDRPGDVRLEVIVPDPALEPHLSLWLRRVAATGVVVRVFAARTPRSGFDEKTHELGNGASARLPHPLGAIHFDGPRADAEIHGDHFVGHPGHHA